MGLAVGMGIGLFLLDRCVHACMHVCVCACCVSVRVCVCVCVFVHVGMMHAPTMHIHILFRSIICRMRGRMYVGLSVCLSGCLSVCLSVCL